MLAHQQQCVPPQIDRNCCVCTVAASLVAGEKPVAVLHSTLQLLRFFTLIKQFIALQLPQRQSRITLGSAFVKRAHNLWVCILRGTCERSSVEFSTHPFGNIGIMPQAPSDVKGFSLTFSKIIKIQFWISLTNDGIRIISRQGTALIEPGEELQLIYNSYFGACTGQIESA
jgi:hypothetical protein